MVALTASFLGIVASQYTTGVAGPTYFQDSVVRADSTNLNTSAPYAITEVTGDAQIVSNSIKPVSDGDEPRVRWDQDVTSTNMYTQAVVNPFVIGSSQEIAAGVIARFAPTSDTSYWFVWDGTDAAAGNFHLVTLPDGTHIASAAGSLAQDDVLRIECNGTSIVGKKNGSTVVSATDSAITTGTRGGVSTYRQSTSGGTDVGVRTVEWGIL